MPNYKLSASAVEDLAQIATSTIEVWGNAQAKTYLQSIDDILFKLAQFPDLGRSRPELHVGARSFLVQKHVVFYRIREHGIDVARILHQRMEPSNALDL